MRIVIVGAGKVGYTLAQRLTQEGHDITVIEREAERRAILERHLDVMTIPGNGAASKVLEEAEIERAGMIIAVTDSDEVNMIACLAAKQAGVPKAIARVRNTEYIQKEQLAFSKILGIDLVINPEMVTAIEISQILNTPAALDVEDFASGKVRMLEVKIMPENNFGGKTLKELPIPANLLVAGILRKEKMIIPRGNDTIEIHDSVFFLGEKAAIHKLEDAFVQTRTRLERIMIIGAGRIGKYLALLMEKTGISVKIIEKDRKRCEELSQVVDHAMVLCGDGTDAELLVEEGIGDCDAVICLTDDDKLNLLVALMAKHLGTPKTFVRVGRPEYIGLMEKVGVDVVFSPRLITAGAILRQVRRGDIVAITLVEGAKAEAIEIDVPDGSKIVGKPLKNLKFPPSALVGAIVRQDQTIVPNGETVFQAGDKAVIFTLPDIAVKVVDFIKGRN